MNPAKQPKPAPRNDGGSPGDGETGATTPGADMQPDDAGTAASGNDGRGSPVGNAMKQTSKTPSERGDR